jgi:hypothetical protein
MGRAPYDGRRFGATHAAVRCSIDVGGKLDLCLRGMLGKWMTWAIVTALMAVYVGVARIESQPTRGKLELTVGNEIELKVFRVFDDMADAGLNVDSGPCNWMPGLPDSGRTGREVPGFWVITPGTLIRLEFSIAPYPPITFEAVPPGRDCGENFRRLISNLSVAPGLYPRPPRSVQQIPLRHFVNKLRIKVVEVDPQVTGSTVDVAVLAPLGFKGGDASLFFFWFAFFLEPVFWVTQSIWLLILMWHTIRPPSKKAV